MKTGIGGKARLLARLALIAALPLGIWACEDAGDGPGGPTGPSTKYNPDIDYAGATITATVDRANVGVGETFTIIATFKDANGLPVDGMPLLISAENGGAAGYFEYATNPTLTETRGKASISVLVTDLCPPGSYRFVVATVPGGSSNGPQARAYVGIEVAAVAVVNLQSGGDVPAGTQAFFTATASASSGCAVRYMFKATGAGMSYPDWTMPDGGDTNPWIFQIPSPETTGSGSGTLVAGTLNVSVLAYCNGSTTGVESNQASVTVL